MFIKVFIPNSNGKIELTDKELEELLKEAADKAVTEKCANCTKGYWYNDNNGISTTPGLTIRDPSRDNIVYCSRTATENTKIDNDTLFRG